MADSIMKKYAKLREGWSYDYGVICKAIEGVYETTKDKKYYDYIKENMDYYIEEDGLVKGYDMDKYNIDFINNGKILLYLYNETKEEKYKQAIETLRSQLRTHPRTSQGGFWHKNIYPHQMWLDGLYMGQPFYCEYAKVFEETSGFDDVCKQFILMDAHARDKETGLLYHGWDESKSQLWADPETGCSPHFWGRAMGWFGMALVDMLDYLPRDHKDRDDIIDILKNYVQAISKVQDREEGLWYQVLNHGDKEGNYFEASASCMFIYTLAKAVNKAYIDRSYLEVADKGIKGVLKNLLFVDDEGNLHLKDTVYVSGLGGNPYRDGSYDYYISEPKETNNLLGVGAFIKACLELESLGSL